MQKNINFCHKRVLCKLKLILDLKISIYMRIKTKKNPIIYRRSKLKKEICIVNFVKTYKKNIKNTVYAKNFISSYYFTIKLYAIIRNLKK